MYLDIKNASIKWNKYGSDIILENNKLNIKSLTEQNFGLYECTGKIQDKKTSVYYSIEKQGNSVIGRTKKFIYSPNMKTDIVLDFMTNFDDISLNERIEIKCSSSKGNFFNYLLSFLRVYL